MQIRRNTKTCFFIFSFSFGIILFVSIAFAMFNRSTKMEKCGEELKKDQPLIKGSQTLIKDSVHETVEISENYRNLNNLTFNFAKRKIVSETFEIVTYDIERNISQQMKQSVDCIFMTKQVPNYYVCVHDRGKDGFSDQLRESLAWEGQTMSIMKSFFHENSNATLLDLGSNIGVHSLYAAVLNENVQVVGVEPFPQNVLRIHKAAHLNKVQNRITIVLAAISYKRGPVSFAKTEDFNGNTLVLQPSRENDTGKFAINSLLFDDLRHLVKTKRALLKIDIEGMECHAFTHADKIFDAVDFPIILMEVEHTIRQGELCYTTMLKFLNDRSYTPFHYPLLDKPLNYSNWKEWGKEDVYFKKIYK